MKEKDIDQLFRDSFGTIDEAPDPKIWDNIAKELSKTPIAEIKRQKSWRVVFQIAALITVVGSLAMIIWNQQQHKIINDTPQLVSYQHPDIKQHSAEPVSTEMIKLNPYSTVTTTRADKYKSNPVNQDQNIISSAAVDILETDEIIDDEFNNQEEFVHELVTIKANEHYIVGTQLEEIKMPQIDDIQHTITTDNIENIDTSEVTERNTVVTTVLNKITENIDVLENKNIRFSADEEGSLRLQIINSIVKNPFNKRK